jgi:hypothetical protein
LCGQNRTGSGLDEAIFLSPGYGRGLFFTFLKKVVYFSWVLWYNNHVSNKEHHQMKLIKSATRQEATYKVGDEIIFQQSIFDGRTSHRKNIAMTVIKVNKVTLIVKDKYGNTLRLDLSEDKITTREALIKEFNDSIA